jgi:hypothetical protein
MGHQVGVWIDRTKAVVVSASAGRVTKKTLASDVGPQARSCQQLDGFCDRVIRVMGQPEAIVIFGPDEAKLRFSERLGRSAGLAATSFGLANSTTLTDPQIVAKVKGYYGLGRRVGRPALRP